MNTIRPSLLRLLHLRVGRNEIERMAADGTVSPADWLGYKHVWRWATPRVSGVDGLHHDAFVLRYGLLAFERRLNKVRQALGLPPMGGGW